MMMSRICALSRPMNRKVHCAVIALRQFAREGSTQRGSPRSAQPLRHQHQAPPAQCANSTTSPIAAPHSRERIDSAPSPAPRGRHTAPAVRSPHEPHRCASYSREPHPTAHPGCAPRRGTPQPWSRCCPARAQRSSRAKNNWPSRTDIPFTQPSIAIARPRHRVRFTNRTAQRRGVTPLPGYSVGVSAVLPLPRRPLGVSMPRGATATHAAFLVRLCRNSGRHGLRKAARTPKISALGLIICRIPPIRGHGTELRRSTA
jgi:hypothetical protein